MNTSQQLPDGVYWRSAPDWNTPVRDSGVGFFTGTYVTVHCYQLGLANVPYSTNHMWVQASWASGPGSGSGWMSEHFVNDGAPNDQAAPGVPPCGSGGSGVSETTGGVAHTWTNYTNAGGTQGPSLASNQTVTITCRLTGFTVSDGNSWWYQIASSPWNNAYYATADAFYNNGQTSGSLIGTPFVDTNVPICGGGGGGGGGGGVNEIAGGLAHTWTNYSNAGGTQGPSIAAYSQISITCKLSGFQVSDGNTWWYQIGSSPWNNNYYVTADAFYNNGASSGSLIGTPFVDPAVPDCGHTSSGFFETTGGVTGTHTNYTNAGGETGQSIASNATVQINCRITGWDAPDGNTWWYQIASSPWSDVYYASADAFYNNGQTSGSLAGTPYVDSAVPVCSNNQAAPTYATGVGGSSSSTFHAAANTTTCIRVDPVNCASGDYTETATDISISGRGPGLQVVRTYNDLNGSTAGLFGYGWSSTLDQHLTFNARDGSINVTLADGSQTLATPNGSGGYTLPSQADSTLQPNGDGTYTLTERSTRFLTFSATGQLLALKDINGYQTTLTYNSSHQLASVTDSSGRTLTVTIGNNGFVSSISDPLNRTTTYAYSSAGDLTSVTDPLGRFTAYTYDENHWMLTMTNPRGGVVTNTYDSQGRVTQQTDPVGKTATFAYSGDNFSSLGGTTTVTEPRGNVELEQYVDGFMTEDIRGYNSASPQQWSYGFDPSDLGSRSGPRPARESHD